MLVDGGELFDEAVSAFGELAGSDFDVLALDSDVPSEADDFDAACELPVDGLDRESVL